MPKLDAVVLAGGRVSEALGPNVGVAYQAQIPINSQPMVQYVVQALRAVPEIDRIVVVGPQELNQVLSSDRCEVVELGETMVENLLRGLDTLQTTNKVLLATGDIPLLTPEAVVDFLTQARTIEKDIYYPIVSKEDNEASYPGVRRTYVRLKEGVFTGGNLILVNPQCVYKCQNQIARAVAMRKKPWQLARLLGFSFILKLLFNRLGLEEIEERVGGILGFQGKALISRWPEIGIDVDKSSDLQLARKIIEGNVTLKENVKSENDPGTIDTGQV